MGRFAKTILEFLVCFAAVFVVTPGSAFQRKEVKAFQTVGNPQAPKGGTYNVSIDHYPDLLDPFDVTDATNSAVLGYLFESLLKTNPETYEDVPGLAERWEQSKSSDTITFWIRSDMRWHDGRPITAEDVKFSFDRMNSSEGKTTVFQSYFENISEAKIKGPYEIEFRTKRKYFGNLQALGHFLWIAPKHLFVSTSKNLARPVGSGPYKVEKIEPVSAIVTLSRNLDWWGSKAIHLQGYANFDKIIIRVIKETDSALEMLKKGSLDLLELTPQLFLKQDLGEKVQKFKVENSSVRETSFVAWNLKNPLFTDQRVRKALARLMNRDLMNEKILGGLFIPVSGPWYPQSPFASLKVKPISFNVEQARMLLKESGWEDTDKDGIRDKVIEGTKLPFRFEVIYSDHELEKLLVLYKEDLRGAQIQMNLRRVDFQDMMKAMDDRKFEALSAAWGGGSMAMDPKQVWHSASIEKGGSNFIGYRNERVDGLIDEARDELHREKRKLILRRIYEVIADDVPMAFMFAPKYSLFATSKRMGMSKPSYKYGIDEGYWWLKSSID